MKWSILLLAGFICVGSAAAQQSVPGPSIPPLPPGPLLNRMPAYSRWAIITDAPGPKVQERQTARGAKTPPPPREVTYTKSGSIILEESPGRQVWHFRNMEGTIYAGRSLPVLGSAAIGNDLYTVDFSRSDFAGLDWISPETYKGIAVQKGRQCLVFQGQVTPWTPLEVHQLKSQAMDAAIRANFEASKAGGPAAQPNFHFDPSTVLEPAIVYIDMETRLPILLLFGKDNEQEREYLYQSSPPAPLTLPPTLAQAAAQQQQRVDDMSRTPPPP